MTSQSKSLCDLEEDLDLLLKVKDVGATACRAAPICNTYSDYNKEYFLHNTTPSSWLQKGLEDVGVTTCRAAPALENHTQPDGHTESFLGSLLGLTITSTPQGRFMYWKGLHAGTILPGG
jgi:hypothetical protein